MAGELTYEREVRIEASPATVFELLTDPDRYASWIGVAEMEAKPGAAYTIHVVGTVSGEFVEVERDRRVVFTWGWEGDRIPIAPGETTVEFTLTPDGDHTILRLRHSGLTPAVHAFHTLGWDTVLVRLAAVAEGRDPGPNPLDDPATRASFLSTVPDPAD